MSKDIEECYAVKTDVEVLKNDVSNINGLLTRLDTAIDKIADVSTGINQILAVHEQSIGRLEDEVQERKRLAEKESELLHQRITDMKDESAKHHKENHAQVMQKLDKLANELSAELKSVSNRVATLEKWRWYIAGASALALLILTNYTKFFG
jgi:DNA repair exonuclease SbcCD ATPase subunit